MLTLPPYFGRFLHKIKTAKQKKASWSFAKQNSQAQRALRVEQRKG
jgi:hypothetical protein